MRVETKVLADTANGRASARVWRLPHSAGSTTVANTNITKPSTHTLRPFSNHQDLTANSHQMFSGTIIGRSTFSTTAHDTNIMSYPIATPGPDSDNQYLQLAAQSARSIVNTEGTAFCGRSDETLPDLLLECHRARERETARQQATTTT